MRWIGQHIWPFKSRFRSDAIIEKDSSVYMGANEVLSQTGGNVTLANISAVDASTISTLNTALTAGDLTSIVAGTGMTGSSLTGPIPTLNVIGGNGITANANDLAITQAQTTITSVINAELIVGESDNCKMLFSGDSHSNEIGYYFEGAEKLRFKDGGIVPSTTNTLDLGTASLEFKNAYFDGTVTSDAFAGPLTGNATTATTLATSRNFQTNLASTSTAGFTGAAACSPGVTGTLAVGNGGTGLTSLSTLLNSNVTSVSGSSGTVTSIGNLTGDVTSSNRATTLAATQPNIESIGTAGDTLAILSTAVNISSNVKDHPQLSLINTHDSPGGPYLILKNERDGNGLTDNDYLGLIRFDGEDVSGNPQSYASIYAQANEVDNTDESGTVSIDVYSKFNNTNGLKVTGSRDTAGKVDVTVGAHADSIVTIPGQLLAVNGGMGTSHHGNYIKLIPSDFVANDDGGNTRFGIGYVDTAGEADYGMRVSHNDTELFAFVSIPEGMKATHVEVFGRRAKAVEVFEVQINASTLVSKGTGTCGIPAQALGDEEFAITEVNSTATNLLAIEVTVTSNSADKVYGGRVKIAAV